MEAGWRRKAEGEENEVEKKTTQGGRKGREGAKSDTEVTNGSVGDRGLGSGL